ncbi:MAG: DNA primase [Saprospiraceae bacterium]
MIKEKTVQEIFDRVRVEDVVQEFVNLKRRGVNMIGNCPFHNEKTPSFTVSPAKGIYKCFGCGKAGNAVKFIMEHENISFPEALRYLAKKYNIEIEETELSDEQRQEKQERDSLYIVNEFAKQFFQTQLLNTDRGKSVGLSYYKKRGFRLETIEKWGLGYAPNQRDLLTSSAVTQGYSIDLLRRLGLTSKFDSDFFRDRVMFTIHNLTGKPIAFAGRILQTDVKAPKYVNSPETDIYFKSKVLYGAYFAKTAIRKQDECILVEGYTDTISLHQSGIENVVASSGTSLTVGQINLIKRYTPNIKILYDGDAAGIKAALRGLDLVLEQDMNVKVVLLPDGEDPDSYLQQVGVTVFKEYIADKAEDFILFKTNLLLAEAGNDPVKKAELINDIVSSIAKIPDAIKRSLYLKQCAEIMGLEEAMLMGSLNKSITRDRVRKRQQAENERRRKQRQAQQNDKSGKPASPQDDGSFPTQEPAYLPTEGEMPPDTFAPQRPPSSAPQPLGDEFQEKHIAQLLVMSGDQIFDEEEKITVAQYIIGNIEDVIDDFDNGTYQKIAKETRARLLKKQPVSEQFFTHHPDNEISQAAINLITSPYEFSANWAERYEIYLTTQKVPELNFTPDSIESLKRFKLRKIMKMCNTNQEKIKKYTASQEMDKMMRHLKVQQKLLAMRNELAKELNTVILK